MPLGVAALALLALIDAVRGLAANPPVVGTGVGTARSKLAAVTRTFHATKPFRLGHVGRKGAYGIRTPTHGAMSRSVIECHGWSRAVTVRVLDLSSNVSWRVVESHRCPGVWFQNGSWLPLADPLEQLGGPDLQRAGEPDDRAEAGLALATLKERDLGSVDVRRGPERFLRQALLHAECPEVASEAFRGGHPGIVGPCRQKVYRQNLTWFAIV